jgi:hypothetical protein
MRKTFLLMLGVIAVVSASSGVQAEPGEKKCILESARWAPQDDINYCNRQCGEGHWTVVKMDYPCMSAKGCLCQ